jgi:hypothetical protein
MKESKLRSDWALARTVGLGIALFLLAFLSPVIYGIDGISMLAVAESLVTHWSLAVPSDYGIAGVGGLHYSKLYPLLSLLAIPPVALGAVVARLMHLPVHFTAEAFALILSPILVAAAASLVMMLARRLGGSRQGSILAAVSFVFGTIMLVYAREFFAEPLLALMTVAAVYLALGDGRERSGVGALTALAVLAKPTGAVLGPLIALHAVLRDRSRKHAALALIGTAVGIAIYLVYDRIRFGDTLNFGHPLTLSFANFAPGASVLLVSPWYGLFWYCPVVFALAGLNRRLFMRLDVLLIVATALAYLSVYAMHGGGWGGGWSWGPRYLVPVLPILMALCGLLEGKSRRALVILTVLGFLINAPTLISYYQRIYQENRLVGVEPVDGNLWSLEQAPFVRIWGSAAREISDAQQTDVNGLVRQAGQPEDSRGSWRTLKIVAVWWWMLPVVGIPRSAGAAVSALLAIAGLALIGWELAGTRGT